MIGQVADSPFGCIWVRPGPASLNIGIAIYCPAVFPFHSSFHLFSCPISSSLFFSFLLFLSITGFCYGFLY